MDEVFVACFFRIFECFLDEQPESLSLNVGDRKLLLKLSKRWAQLLCFSNHAKADNSADDCVNKLARFCELPLCGFAPSGGCLFSLPNAAPVQPCRSMLLRQLLLQENRLPRMQFKKLLFARNSAQKETLKLQLKAPTVNLTAFVENGIKFENEHREFCLEKEAEVDLQIAFWELLEFQQFLEKQRDEVQHRTAFLNLKASSVEQFFDVHNRQLIANAKGSLRVGILTTIARVEMSNSHNTKNKKRFLEYESELQNFELKTGPGILLLASNNVQELYFSSGSASWSSPCLHPNPQTTK